MAFILRLVLSVVLAVLALGVIQATHPGADAGASVLQPGVFALAFIVIAAGVFISPMIKSESAAETGGQTAPAKAKSGDKREEGSVKWFNISKGYGFIKRVNGEEVFVHFRAIRGEGRRVLREGQTVKFSLVQGDKGPQADDVEIVAG